MCTRSFSMWAASMPRTLGGRLEPKQTAAPDGPQVAGQVDPLLPVPVGEQGVDGQNVLEEEVPTGSARGDRRQSQHAGPDRALESDEGVDLEAFTGRALYVGERLLG